MAEILQILNDARKETRNGLAVFERIKLPPETGEHLEIGEKLRLRIAVKNILEKGGGRGMYGDAHFKNITVRVRKSDFVKFLTGPDGSTVDDKQKSYTLLKEGETLPESDWRVKNVWFEAIKESPSDLTPELIATVRVVAEFDIGRYFTSRWRHFVYHNIHD